MKRPAYPRYKPSGIEWFGDVPEHWATVALRRTTTRYAGGTPDRSNDSYWEDGTIPWINSGAVNQGLVTEPSAYITEDAYRNSSARWIANGNLVMALAGQGKTKGMVAQVGIATTCNQSMAAICPMPPMETRYLYWLLISQYDHIRNMAGGEARDGLNLEILGAIPCLKVPPVEQRAIAAYLDRETGRVDRLVAKKRELIERLKEKRTALISRTVTRGLPAEAAAKAGLLVNPLLKPSGLDWLGDIPAHWFVKRLKFELWKIEQGWSPQCDNTPAGEGEWGVLKAGAVNGPEFDPNENKRLPDEEKPLPEFEINTGDFLISRANTRELLGSTALVRRVQPRLLLCDKLYRLTIRKQTLNSEFLLRFMRSTPGHFEFERDASGSSASMQNIGQQSVRNLWIPLPPLPEQAAIAAYLDAETAKLDALVGKVEEAVERLQEYRTALITAAVTGKIDVRSSVALRPSKQVTSASP